MAEANGSVQTKLFLYLFRQHWISNRHFRQKLLRTIEGWKYVPVMCTHEMDVPGSMPLCIRILMHVNTEIPQKDIKHIYQNKAVKLTTRFTKKMTSEE